MFAKIFFGRLSETISQLISTFQRGKALPRFYAKTFLEFTYGFSILFTRTRESIRVPYKDSDTGVVV